MLKGKLIREIELPGIGTASGFGGKRKDTETFYAFTSFTTPTTIYRYDLTTGKSFDVSRAESGFQSERLRNETGFLREQRRHESADVYYAQKRLEAGRQQSDVSLRLRRLQRFADAGVFDFAIWCGWKWAASMRKPNLRGGGEYGEDWHQAGMKLKKQNVFDDFIAAAEWLIANKYTSTPKLAIGGGSNGGLLVGAVYDATP